MPKNKFLIFPLRIFIPVFLVSVTGNSIVPKIYSKHLDVHNVESISIFFYHQNIVIIQLLHPKPALPDISLPINVHVKILNSKGHGLVGGAFGRWLCHEGRALMNEVSDDIKEIPQSSLPLLPCKATRNLQPGSKPSPNLAASWSWISSLQNCEK